MFAGVFLGLGAAFCQSLSYVFSRLFLSQFPRRSFTLLALAHVIMGALALCILPFVIPQSLPNWKELAPPLLGASVCYLCGQTCLFMALRYAEPSRVSPLLGIKIVVLALVTTVFMQSNYTFLQWTAVGLSVTAALMLRQSGSRIPWDSMAWVLAACVGYAFSDINIRLLVQRFSYLPLSRAALVSACLSYLLCLFFTCPLLLFSPRPGLRMWGYAIPFALAWFTAMLFLFACFGSIGVVFGNIVQSSRGLLSVVMGSLLAKWGWHFLEVRVSRRTFFKRVTAALIMLAAIVLFYTGRKQSSFRSFLLKEAPGSQREKFMALPLKTLTVRRCFDGEYGGL